MVTAAILGIHNGVKCACIKTMPLDDLRYVSDSSCDAVCQFGQSEYPCGGAETITIYVASMHYISNTMSQIMYNSRFLNKIMPTYANYVNS